MMDCYRPYDVTLEAKRVAEKFATLRIKEEPKEIRIKDRYPIAKTIDPVVKGKTKIKALGTDELQFGRQIIDLGKIEQIVELGQVKAIGDIIYRITSMFDRKCLRKVLEEIEKKGFLSILPARGEYAEPRKYEVAFALNRLRGMKCITL
jgi:predicted ABC-class ATPase